MNFLLFNDWCTIISRRVFTFCIIIILLVLIQGSAGLSAIINVPSDQSTIQAGIDAASDFDTVLVAPGTYYENIRYFGKPIVVTSHFMYDKDPGFIQLTVINGSQPTHPDTASVVRMIDYETSDAVLQGFTITGGNGTTWPDPHGAGDYREGGGILCEFSSPVIQYNLIIYNNANYPGPGMNSAGGGGIRTGDGDPLIANNIIMYNTGRYGAGVVFNYCDGTLRNNVIAYNTGGEDFGGGGVWKFGTTSGTLMENNTIVYNTSTVIGGEGGGIWISGYSNLRNNIVWGNFPDNIQGSSNVTYSIVGGGYSGTGNLDVDPLLIGEYFYLSDISPAIDGGDPATQFNDVENPNSPGNALWPAMGSLRNDIGAYGGQNAMPFEWLFIFADIQTGWTPLDVNFRGYSHKPALSWSWDFGDGHTSDLQNPSNTYESASMFDVVLTVTHASGVLLKNIENFIIAVNDTVKATSISGGPGEQVVVDITANNTVPLNIVTIPVQLTGALRLKYDSSSTVGCRNGENTWVNLLLYDAFNGKFIMQIKHDNPDLVAIDPGQGTIMKLYFTIHATATVGQTKTIDISNINSTVPHFESDYYSYDVFYENAVVEVVDPPCCIGMRGNVDLIDEIDIGDIVYLVEYQFDNGPVPPCDEAADVDGEVGIDIGDVVFLVEFQFNSGPPPGDCPI